MSQPVITTNWQRMLDAAISGKIPRNRLMPYMNHLSMPLVNRWGERFVEIDWEASPETHQGAGIVFGGYIAALADYAAGSVMLTFIGDKDLFFTNGLNIEYRRPIRTGPVLIRAEVSEVTDSKVIVEVTFRNSKGELYSLSRVNQTLFRQG
jgi:uncharacterized protein (TIGR00369 family)